MTRHFPAVLLASVFLAVSLSAQTSVWKVSRAGSEVYLGGTCHVLRAGDFPLPAEFDQAFAASAKLYFETDLARIQSPEMAQIVASRGLFAEGGKLEGVLTAEAWTAVRAHAAKAGLPLAEVNRFKPWFFAVVVSMVELQKAGIAQEGVDLHYFRKAQAAGKAVAGLEAFERHVDFIVGIGDGIESELVIRTIEDLAQVPVLMPPLLAAWRAGDVNEIDKLMLKEMRAGYPALFEKLMVQRNNEWLPKIEGMLATPEIELVLVGVGHMAGPEGLLAQLRGRGCQVEQVVRR